jgi:hypothetical protein
VCTAPIRSFLIPIPWQSKRCLTNGHPTRVWPPPGRVRSACFTSSRPPCVTALRSTRPRHAVDQPLLQRRAHRCACSSTAVFWSGPARLHPIAFARAPSHCFETELGTVLVRPTGPTRLPWRTWTGVCDLVPAPPLAASATPSDSTGEHVLAGRPTGRPRLAVERR